MLSRTRAVVAASPGKLEMRTYPLPEIGEEGGILKIELAGVCGSDPGIFKGKSARGPRPRPIILLKDMISHRLPLEKARHALSLVGGELAGETCMKVVPDPSISA